ncbi:MAG: glycosyltransferase family 39 protein, partial [Candidatus Erginobacter occultus]|nr:glycosyltransferase family 39 protein [Candidatus Erginobacter occultus]
MKRHLLPVIALSLATFFLALPTLDYGYLLEDYKYIRSYSLGEIAQTFSGTWEPTQRETRGYRPLHSVHYAFFYRLIGGDPLRNHLLKTGLLIVGTLLLYVFSSRCTGSRSAAFWMALTYIFLGGNAWQVSWLNHRHHILQLQLVLLSLIAFDCYLARRRNLPWLFSFLSFLLAFLLKEEVATFPLVLAAYALLVKGEKARSLLRPLLPFFLLAVFLVLMRTAVLRSLPADDSFQPAVPPEAGYLLREYGRSVFSTLLQTYGVQDPGNWEFPMYGSGLTIFRDYLGLLALLGFVILGGALLYHCGTKLEKKSFGFGILLLLLISVIVAAWYR